MRGNCSIFQALLIIPINQFLCPSLTEHVKLLKETNILYISEYIKKIANWNYQGLRRENCFRHLFHVPNASISHLSNYQLRGRNGGLRRYRERSNKTSIFLFQTFPRLPRRAFPFRINAVEVCLWINFVVSSFFLQERVLLHVSLSSSSSLITFYLVYYRINLVTSLLFFSSLQTLAATNLFSERITRIHGYNIIIIIIIITLHRFTQPAIFILEIRRRRKLRLDRDSWWEILNGCDCSTKRDRYTISPMNFSS